MADHKVINFIQKYATNPITGSSLKLLDWQIDLIKKMYKPDGSLTAVRNAYLIGSKKCCKTSTVSLLATWRLFSSVNEVFAVMSNSESQSLLHVKSLVDLFSKSNLMADLKIYKMKLDM